MRAHGGGVSITVLFSPESERQEDYDVIRRFFCTVLLWAYQGGHKYSVMFMLNSLPTLRPLIVGGLIKKRGLAIFPEEINGEGVNKWKWVNFVMQCLNKGAVNSWGGSINFFKLC